MKNLYKFCSVSAIAIPLLITGCSSSSSASETTAKVIIDVSFEKRAENQAVFAVLKKQPKYRQMIACYAKSLSDHGWTSAQHDQYMEATGGTGDIDMLDLSKYSEGEGFALLSPLGIASTTCLN